MFKLMLPAAGTGAEIGVRLQSANSHVTRQRPLIDYCPLCDMLAGHSAVSESVCCFFQGSGSRIHGMEEQEPNYPLRYLAYILTETLTKAPNDVALHGVVPGLVRSPDPWAAPISRSSLGFYYSCTMGVLESRNGPGSGSIFLERLAAGRRPRLVRPCCSFLAFLRMASLCFKI